MRAAYGERPVTPPGGSRWDWVGQSKENMGLQGMCKLVCTYYTQRQEFWIVFVGEFPVYGENATRFKESPRLRHPDPDMITRQHTDSEPE